MAALQAAIKASGSGAYKLAAVVANAVAKAILGRGLSLRRHGRADARHWRFHRPHRLGHHRDIWTVLDWELPTASPCPA